MSSLNKVQLIGNLGRDPEVRTFQNGGKVCNLALATSQKWKDRDTGETRERTDWHNVVIFAEGLVKVAEQYLRKGSKVYVEGRLETRKWQDQSGQDRYTTEVVLRPYGGTLILLGESGGSGRASSQEEAYRNGPQKQPPRSDAPPPSSGSYGPPGDIDDEIPF